MESSKRKFNLKEERVPTQDLDTIQKKLSVIKRLTKEEFLKLTVEQREQYISMVEKIAAELSNKVEKNHLNYKNTHLILEAVNEASKIEKEKELKRLEVCRKNLIENQSGNNCISVKRLLHRYKLQHITTDDLLNFIENSYLLKYFSLKDLKTSSVLLLDLKNWKTPNYCIEECLIFSNESNLNFKKRILIEDEEAKKKRSDFQNYCGEVDTYNKDINTIWDKLEPLEKLKYFCKNEFKKEFDLIVEKGKSLSLSNDKIKDMIINSDLLQGYEEGKLPLRKIDENLQESSFNISLEVAKKLMVPEKVLLDHFTSQDLKEDYKLLEEKLGLLYLKEFEKYWEEINYFSNVNNSIKTPKMTSKM